MRLDKKLKKKLILNAPYVLFVYLFDKVAQGICLAPGADASQKLLHLADGFGSAFASTLPSFHPIDLLIGIAGAVIVWVVVYVRGKNAKKFRKNTEYGSARWGTEKDIKPFVDPKFENNVILTKTEFLTNPLLLQYANTRIEELDAERQKQLRLVADLTANSVSSSQIDSITGYLDDWESVSFDDKRKVVDILISQIDATSESVTIHWKI